MPWRPRRLAGDRWPQARGTSADRAACRSSSRHKLEQPRVSAEVQTEEAISFLLAYPPELMRAVSVSSLVNSVRNDHPSLLNGELEPLRFS
jgi:putative SOS response-associated peptidase YedK